MANPAACIRSKDSEWITVYFLTKFGNVSWRRYQPPHASPQEFIDPAEPHGAFRAPSTISVVSGTVIGSFLTADLNDSEKKFYVLAELMPIVRSLATQENLASVTRAWKNSSISTAFDINGHYIYFFQQPVAEGPLSLAMRSGDKTDIVANVQPAEYSRLATVSIDTADKKFQRAIFYQPHSDKTESNPIFYASHTEAGASATLVPSTGVAGRGTPLAVVTVGTTPNHSIYLYFMTAEHLIWRSVFRKGAWKGPVAVPNANVATALPLQETGLMAILAKDGQNICLFYLFKGVLKYNQKSRDNEYSLVLDPLEYPS